MSNPNKPDTEEKDDQNEDNGLGIRKKRRKKTEFATTSEIDEELARASNPDQALQEISHAKTGLTDAGKIIDAIKGAREDQDTGTDQAPTQATDISKPGEAQQIIIRTQGSLGFATAGTHPRQTPDTRMHRVTLNKRKERLSITHDLTVGDFYNKAFFDEYPELFGTSNKITLSSCGLKLVSIRIKDASEENISKIRGYCPQSICLTTTPLPGTDEQILHIVLEDDKLAMFAHRLNEDPNISAIVLGGNNAKPTISISGITIIGTDITHNIKTLRDFDETKHKGQKFKILEHNKRPATQDNRINLDPPSSKRNNIDIASEEVKELPPTDCFVIQIKLPQDLSNCDIAILHDLISEMAVTEGGAKVHGQGNELIVFGIHERPDHTALIIKELQKLLQRAGILDQTVLKYVHSSISIENRHVQFKMTGNDREAPVNIPIVKLISGNALMALDALPDIPGQIPVSGLNMFSNDDRYRADLTIKKRKYLAQDGSEKEVEILEEISTVKTIVKRGFILRQKEQAAIEEMTAQASTRSRVYEIEGVAGIGKSSLLLNSLPTQNTIIIRSFKGRGRKGLIDLANQLISMANKYDIDAHFPSDSKDAKYLKASIRDLNEFAQKGTMTGNDETDYYSNEVFRTYALDVIKFLGLRKKEEGSTFCISFDDLDDFEAETLEGARNIIYELAKSPEVNNPGNTDYAGVACFITLRSDVSFAEEQERYKRAKRESGVLVEHQTAMRSIKMLRHGQLTVKPIIVAIENKDGTIKLANELQDFIVGKTLQKLNGGEFKEFANTSRVSNFESFAALILNRVGQKNENGEIAANPYLMVQVINELIETNLIAFDSSTREIHIVNYDKAEREIPKDPEGIREKQFRRMGPGHQQIALYLFLLDGIDIELINKIEVTQMDEFAQGELIERREIIKIGSDGKSNMSAQWKGYLGRNLRGNPDKQKKMERELLDKLLQIDNDSSAGNIYKYQVDPIKICQLAKSSIASGDKTITTIIAKRYALRAAETELENQNYEKALEYAALYLSVGGRQKKAFEANLIAMEACIFMSDFEEANKFASAIVRSKLNTEQQLKLAQVLCENSYLYFKHCELGGEGSIQEALDKYDKTIKDFSDSLESTNYGKALLYHHMSIALSERLGKAMFTHEANGKNFGVEYNEDSDKQRFLAYKRAVELANMADEILGEMDESTLNLREQKLKIANTTLLGTLCLSITQIEHNRSNLSIVNTIQDEADTSEKAVRTRERINTAIEFSKKGLTLAAMYKVLLPSLKSRAATCRTVATLLKGDSEGIADLVQNALIFAIDLHPRARLNVLLHTLSASIEHCKGVKKTDPQTKGYLLTIGYDLTAEVIGKYPNLYFAVYNHAEACILKALTNPNEVIAQVEYMKATELIRRHSETLKKEDDNFNFETLLRKHILVAHVLGGDALIVAEALYPSIFHNADERDRHIQKAPNLPMTRRVRKTLLDIINRVTRGKTRSQKATEIQDIDGLMAFDEREANEMLQAYLI